MHKLRYTLGLPVLETETGTQLGEIIESIVDIETTAVYGFVIRGGSLFKAESIVVFEDLVSLGRDALMLRSGEVIHPHPLDSQLLDHKYYLRDLFDKQIFTDSGLRLGVLVDIVFDPITGEMKWYQVSDSIITDLLYGRMLMPLPEAQMIGADKVIVPEVMAQLLHREEGIDPINE